MLLAVAVQLLLSLLSIVTVSLYLI